MDSHVGVSPSWVNALDELDLVALLEGHDGLLVIGADARAALAGLFVFAAVILRVYATNRHLESLLHRFRDLVLVGVTVHFEGVLTELGRELVRLLSQADEF